MQMNGCSFRAYPKMPEGDANGSGWWNVTEKVHGANMQCLVDNKGVVRWSKRTALLDEGDDFFGFRSAGVAAEHEPLARNLMNLVQRRRPEAQLVAVVGELFGGSYPHPDVPVVPGAEPVQTGVWYCPGLRFMAFDVSVDGAPFLAFRESSALLQEAGFLVAQELRSGTAAQCCEFPVEDMQTTLPSRFGLPPIEGNLAEGVVCRGPRGVTVKRKAARFAERRYDAVPRWLRHDQARKRDAAETERLWEALAGVTPQRLECVLSKYGRVRGPEQREEVARLLAADAAEGTGIAAEQLLEAARECVGTIRSEKMEINHIVRAVARKAKQPGFVQDVLATTDAPDPRRELVDGFLVRTLEDVFRFHELEWCPGIKKERVFELAFRSGWRGECMDACMSVLWHDAHMSLDFVERLVTKFETPPGGLHLAAVEEAPTRLLLRLGAGPVNERRSFSLVDTVEVTPLHVAAACGTAGSVTALLEAGADTDALTTYGNTPMHMALGNHVRFRRVFRSQEDRYDEPEFGVEYMYPFDIHRVLEKRGGATLAVFPEKSRVWLNTETAACLPFNGARNEWGELPGYQGGRTVSLIGFVDYGVNVLGCLP